MQLFKWSLLAALVLGVSAPVSAQQKFPFRLNWTLYGEHAPFFVALLALPAVTHSNGYWIHE